MAQRRRRITDDDLLALARARVTLPRGEMLIDYQSDVDLLYIKLTEKPQPTRHKYDEAKHALFNYENNKLVSIEVFDLYGTFVN